MTSRPSNRAKRIAFFLYGAAVYAFFLGTFAYTVGFVANVMVPRSIDSGSVGPSTTALAVNTLLLGLFAVQHAVMARPSFKARWTKVVPRPIERSTFVLATCLVLTLLFWQWRPMPQTVWSVEAPVSRTALYALSAAGWALVLYASFCIDHFDLFGLRQVVLHLRGRGYTHPGFATPRLYRMVRNPLMLGFLIAFWATPVMTHGHLLFALLTTGYILVGIRMEERDLGRSLGKGYRQYRARTPMLLPRFPRRLPVRTAEALLDAERTARTAG